MKSGTTKYLSNLIAFLDAFLIYTSTDGFWARHKTNLRVVPFTTKLRTEETWQLDYGAFSSASQLRNSEKNGLADFRDKILEKGAYNCLGPSEKKL